MTFIVKFSVSFADIPSFWHILPIKPPKSPRYGFSPAEGCVTPIFHTAGCALSSFSFGFGFGHTFDAISGVVSMWVSLIPSVSVGE